MDIKEIIELLFESIDRFGVLITFMVFAMAGLLFYLFKNKTKAEAILTETLQQINQNNSDSVKMTAENIDEIKNMTSDVQKSVHTLNGEIRGMVDILKHLISRDGGQ